MQKFSEFINEKSVNIGKIIFKHLNKNFKDCEVFYSESAGKIYLDPKSFGTLPMLFKDSKGGKGNNSFASVKTAITTFRKKDKDKYFEITSELI